MGLVRPCGCGPGESVLGRVCFMCEVSYSQVVSWVSVKRSVKVGRSGGVGEVLAEDPGSAVKTGPGGVGRRCN